MIITLKNEVAKIQNIILKNESLEKLLGRLFDFDSWSD